MKDVSKILAKHLQRLEQTFCRDWIADFSSFMEFIQANPYTIRENSKRGGILTKVLT